MALARLDEPSASKQADDTFALFNLGFRPFYLLAAAFAILAIPLWAFVHAGKLSLPLPGMAWHAHEMLFGFASAVIVGFLYTAGRNWTGLPTPSGAALAALAALWLAGRLGLLLSDSPIVALIDIAFLPAAAIGLGRVLVRAGNRRNYFVLVLLSLLALANVIFHVAVLGVLSIDALEPLYAALAVIVVLETVIAGRVIPGFTGNAVRGIVMRQDPRLDRAAIAAGALALALWVLQFPAWLASVFLFSAAALHFLRWRGWNSWATRKVPLLWILHLSYLWIPVGMVLLGFAVWDSAPRSAGIHALAIGATAGLIIGMITRTALGHTGRMLIAGRMETTAYMLVQIAALLRVGCLLIAPALIGVGVHAAALAWTIAFLLYLIRYAPFLWRSRVDGRPG